ncbi:MAG TPA: type III secretion system cytoplasmic ring protein SctQ [Xanthobacteraceae bacterium]|nr:type III secretion system cytoplasmic ring protein SctQ [Xanthobacteraceae bacterium]
MLDPTSISPAASAFAIEAELRADPDWLSALPAMTLDEVATRNAFYRRRGVITGALADRAITVETGWRLRRSVSVADPCLLELAVDGQRGEVVLPLQLIDAIAAALPAARQVIGLQSEHAAILLELVLGDALDALEGALGIPLSIVGLRRAHAQARQAESLCLTVTMGDLGSMPCEVVVAPCHARRLAALLDRLAGPLAAALDLDLPACLRVAAATLTVGALRELGPGDVVLVEQAYPPDDAAFLVIAEHFVAPVKIEPGGCRLIAPPEDGRETMWEWSMENNIDPSKAARLEDAALDAIPIRVIFELGRVELPLAELAALAPGMLVPLVCSLDGALDIVANGKRIGHGTLVRIGDSLGVQVTRLFEHA